jgi:hypothetical protein
LNRAFRVDERTMARGREHNLSTSFAKAILATREWGRASEGSEQGHPAGTT